MEFLTEYHADSGDIRSGDPGCKIQPVASVFRYPARLLYLVNWGTVTAFIDVPPITMNGDFYVCFYGSNVVRVVTEVDKATGKSYYYVRDSSQLLPGAIPLKNNTTLPVNWLIRAYGE